MQKLLNSGSAFGSLTHCCSNCIQLFQERLSEKVQATIPKGIVGDFEFTVFQNKFQRMAREAMDVCWRVLKESNKSRFNGYSVRKSALMISHITFRDCRVQSFSDNLSRNSCIQGLYLLVGLYKGASQESFSFVLSA